MAASNIALAQIDETPDEPGEFAPAPAGVQPVIPLNIDDPTYDLWKLRRDDLSQGRDPGPINVQRYSGDTGWMGIPTFFRLPLALVPEDLRVGQVDVPMIGAYTDMGAGQRGASLVNPFKELTIVDYGDAPVDPFSTERSMQAIREIVREIAETTHSGGQHVIPFIIGGDHSLSRP